MRPFRVFAATLATALTLLLAAPAAWAETPSDAPQAHTPPAGEPGAGQTLTDRLVDTATSGITDPEAIAAELSLPAEGGGSLNVDPDGHVLATVMFDASPSASLLDEIGALATIEQIYTFTSAATVRINPTHIDALQQMPGVVSVTPVLQPVTGTSELRGSAGLSASTLTPSTTGLSIGPDLRTAVASPISLTAPPATCNPLPVEADVPLRTDLARERFGVDGTGVTIGIISDSFALHTSPTSWSDDVAAGVLPGPGNPCGHLTAVEVLSDTANPASASDEGRAMAQLVHGIAPGAKLLFADSGTSEIAMAQNIALLADAGADIIVDDITWPSEAYYQKSFISLSIEMAKENHGVAYFTSAGNSNAVGTSGASTGAPISSWQTEAFRPMACPAWVEVSTDDPPPASFDCLDFDPSDAELAYDTLTIGSDDTLTVIGSIGEAMGNVTTTYEVHFYEEDTNPLADPTKLGTGITSFGSGLPGLYGAIDVEAGTTLRMVVVRTGHDPDADLPAIFVGFMRGAHTITERHFLGDGVTDAVGSMTFGHGGDGSGLSVASLHWDDTSKVRDYSSLGPNTQLFEPVSITSAEPSARLPEPVIVDTPHLAAVDGVQTTFFGDPDDYRFFGTSAAAPIAAAAYSLGRSYALEIDNATLTGLMLLATHTNYLNTGQPTNPYSAHGFRGDNVFGAGMIDAVGMLELLPPAGFGDYTSTANSITVAWDAAIGSPIELVLDLYDEGAVTGSSVGTMTFTSWTPTGTSVQTVTLPGNATTHTFTGLQASRNYALVLTANYASGTSSQAILPTAATRAADRPTPTPPDPEHDTPKQRVSDQLSVSGANDATPFIVGATVLVIIGAAAIGAAAWSRSRRR